MKRSLVFLIVALLALPFVSGIATAAEPQDAEISNELLAEMGLAGMERLTDEEGMAIRGKGYRPKRHRFRGKIIAINFVNIDISGNSNDKFTININQNIIIGGKRYGGDSMSKRRRH